MKVITDKPLSGKENMAKDYECYTIAQGFDEKDFILRLYEWEAPTISLGISQKKKILLPTIPASIKIVKRHTGGRAVLHYRELTYNICASFDNVYFGGDLYQSYQKIAACLVSFLKQLGLSPTISKNKGTSSNSSSAICYDSSGLYEIKINEKKLIGSAQKRGKNAFLQHGSIPIFQHSYRLEDFLIPDRLPEKKLNYFALEDFLNSEKNINLSELKETFIATTENYIKSIK